LVINPILLIFDIDGTLTDSAGLTRKALEKTAEELYGVEQTTKGIAAWGQTDLNIFTMMVENNHLQIEDIPGEFRRFEKRYIENLSEGLFASDLPRLHTGVRSLLMRLVREPDIRLTLGTGNIEAAAKVKLNRHGVDHLFPIGGFGSDSQERSELLQVALERSREYYREVFPIGSYWVIGDTPNDVRSGKKIGAETIAVCTGFHSPADLAGMKPTALLPDLSNSDFFLAIVRREIDPSDGQIDFLGSGSIGEEPDPL